MLSTPALDWIPSLAAVNTPLLPVQAPASALLPLIDPARPDRAYRKGRARAHVRPYWDLPAVRVASSLA